MTVNIHTTAVPRTNSSNARNKTENKEQNLILATNKTTAPAIKGFFKDRNAEGC